MDNQPPPPPITGQLTVDANPSTGTFEIPADEWAAMTPRQRRELLDELATDHLNNSGGYGWNLDDPGREGELVDTADPLGVAPTSLAELESAVESANRRADQLFKQINQLAEFIMNQVPGEPSRNESAVECAIRVLGHLQQRAGEIAAMPQPAQIRYWLGDDDDPGTLDHYEIRAVEHPSEGRPIVTALCPRDHADGATGGRVLVTARDADFSQAGLTLGEIVRQAFDHEQDEH